MRFALLLLLAPQVSFGAEFIICGQSWSADHALSWERLEMEFSQGISDRDFSGIQSQLLKKFQDSKNQEDPGVRTAFESKIQDVLHKKIPCCPDFALAMQPSQDAFENDKPVLFGGRIDLSVCDGRRAVQNDELRYFAHAFENVGNLEQAPGRAKTAEAIRNIEKEFDNLLFQGFPMLPWEALANSWLLTDKELAKGSPYNQLVLAHMSVGTSFATERFSKSTPGWGLAVEPLGWVHYPRNGKHQRWVGVSSLLFLRQGAGMGAGFSLRYNHFSAGLTWHDGNDNNRLFDSSPHVFVGLDLYQFAGKKMRQYSEFTDRLKTDTEAMRRGAEDSGAP